MASIRGGRGSRSVNVRGLREVKAALRRAGRAGNRGLKKGLYQEGEGIMAESKTEVPVDKGILKSTGHVEPPREERGTVVVKIGYGGAAAPYALRQHEELSYRHTVGKAKYLTDPAERRSHGMAGRLAKHIEREIG
jgi:hypothetical protein